MSYFRRKDLQFIELCQEMAKIFSTCGKKQYAAILTDDRDRIVGVGYNGGPSGMQHCKDGGCPRLAANSPSGSDYSNCIAIHAEQNAFLNAHADALNLYVNGPPCFTCAKLIVNSGLKNLFYIRDESYAQWPEVHEFLEGNNVICRGFHASS